MLMLQMCLLAGGDVAIVVVPVVFDVAKGMASLVK